MNRLNGHLARCAALVTLVGTGVLVAAQPAAAGYAGFDAVTWAYTDSHDPGKSFVKRAEDAPVGTRIDAAQQKHTSRFYFAFDITSLRKQVIHAADIGVRERSVAECGAETTIELWRTGPITAHTSWNKPPAELELLATRHVTPTWSCPGWIGAEILDAVSAAVARGDAKITFGIRLTAADEQNPALARTVAAGAGMTVSSNVPPTVSDPRASAYGGEGSCGTLRKPTAANRTAYLSATIADPDNSGYTNGQVALWPADHPDQRTEVDAWTYGPNKISREVDLDYGDKTLVAWSARSYDQQDYSPWTKTCYLVVDRTAPAQGPVVTSPVFVDDESIPSGGEGLAGKFLFDARGDRDVTAFRYYVSSLGYSQIVAAKHPGGRAAISFTPKWAGSHTLTVVALDAAGNAGPETQFNMWVPWTAPGVQVEVGGVGLPSTISMQSSLAGLTGFSYQIDGGQEVRFPAAADGTGSAPLTFTHAGFSNVTARTYVKNKVAGQVVREVLVSDAPTVSSEKFNWEHQSVLGDQGTFTFRPGITGVTAYEYSFSGNDGWQRVAAQADGTAVLDWTADRAGWLEMLVRTVQADGSTSEPMQYYFEVADPRPVIWSDAGTSYPRTDGVGLPSSLTFNSWMPNITGYAFTFDGGPEQTISGGSYAYTTVTPTHPGANTVVAQAIYADGTRSPARTYTFQITDAPIVSWNGDNMMPGDTATFTVRPAQQGVVSYRYAFDSYYPGDATQTIPAAPDGTAAVPYTVASPGYHVVEIAGVRADGTTSDFRIYGFIVSDPTVGVYGYYRDFMTMGGIGVPGWMSFHSGMSRQVVKFVYQVNGGPEQDVPMPPESASASTTITPDRNGVNVLTVKSLMTDGRYSPTTTYDFLVGTAPYVTSAQYPNSSWAGGPGVAGEFRFSGGTGGIVSFVYTIDGQTAGEVAPNADGAASVAWTPAQSGSYTLRVHGRLADGTTTDPSTYYIYVRYV
ncbi:RHS repeat domain-containing protein [Catellatospora paridis]|uniref:hypothetical protein n=1 Tax=Catellatospora paridis TaxID=1617086 RepID=UPI0012D402D4|nr:hypothetical protein [Catellatospora paridis]